MGHEDLYEVFNGECYYKGVPEDTAEDHIRKCAPCGRADREMPGCIVLHGQIIKNPYIKLFEVLDGKADDAPRIHERVHLSD